MANVDPATRQLKPVGYRLGGICLIIFALLLLYGVTVVLGQDIQEKSLPRLNKVNENLYRGAQPLTGGVQKLASLGIKTIINLRAEDDNTRSEEADARQIGVRYFNVPLPDLSAPPDQKVDEILKLINDSKNWPVFVHCNHGKDRTGVIIAVYRISHDGWTGEEAKAEAKKLGLSWLQFGMKSYIEEYYEKHKAARPVSTHFYFPRPNSPLIITFST